MDIYFLFGSYWSKCGLTVAYVDDSSYTVSTNNSEKMIERINTVLTNWVKYCNSNMLKINGDKTVMIRISTRQYLQCNGPETVKLIGHLDEDGNEIMPCNTVRTLGINFTKDMTWGDNLQYGENALIPGITKNYVLYILLNEV